LKSRAGEQMPFDRVGEGDWDELRAGHATTKLGTRARKRESLNVVEVSNRSRRGMVARREGSACRGELYCWVGRIERGNKEKERRKGANAVIPRRLSGQSGAHNRQLGGVFATRTCNVSGGGLKSERGELKWKTIWNSSITAKNNQAGREICVLLRKEGHDWCSREKRGNFSRGRR